jgi:hypothetical protein
MSALFSRKKGAKRGKKENTLNYLTKRIQKKITVIWDVMRRVLVDIYQCIEGSFASIFSREENSPTMKAASQHRRQ